MGEAKEKKTQVNEHFTVLAVLEGPNRAVRLRLLVVKAPVEKQTLFRSTGLFSSCRIRPVYNCRDLSRIPHSSCKFGGPWVHDI